MEPIWWVVIVGGAVCALAIVRLVLGYRPKVRQVERYLVGAAQSLGLQESQQDAYSLSEQGGAMLAVLADGKGSRIADGKLLSQYAIEPFMRTFDAASPQMPGYFFEQAARVANRRIATALNGSSGGASVAACIVDDHVLHWASYGDCGVGVFRNDELILLNEGDTFRSLAQRKYRNGEVSREVALAAQRWGTVLKRLGNEEGLGALEQSDQPVRLRAGDKVVLLTKGVVGGLPWQSLERLLAGHDGPQRIAEAVAEAIDNSVYRHENASVVIVCEG